MLYRFLKPLNTRFQKSVNAALNMCPGFICNMDVFLADGKTTVELKQKQCSEGLLIQVCLFFQLCYEIVAIH